MDYREENLDKIKQLGYGIEENYDGTMSLWDANYYYVDLFNSHEDLFDYLQYREK